MSDHTPAGSGAWNFKSVDCSSSTRIRGLTGPSFATPAVTVNMKASPGLTFAPGPDFVTFKVAEVAFLAVTMTVALAVLLTV